MTDQETDILHKRRVDAVMKATVSLVDKLGYPPEAVIEGLLRGAAAVAIGRCGSTSAEASELFTDFGIGLRNLAKPDLRVVD